METAHAISNHPVDVGQRSEAAILAAFVDRGFLVWLPWGVNQRADMLLEVDGRILPIQCKTGRLRNGTIRFSTRSVRANRTGVFFRSYVGEIDCFAVYCPANRRLFIVPCAEGLSIEPTLRLDPTINNQSMRIQWAEDYALEPWTP